MQITESKTKQIFKYYQKELGLEAWDLLLSLGIIEDGDRGQCSVSPSYESATVRINNVSHHRDEEGRIDIVRTIRHEMIHVLLSDINLLSEKVEDKDVFHHVIEHQVVMMERFLDKTHLNPKIVLDKFVKCK